MPVEPLVEELLAAVTPEERHRLLAQERFHSLDLAEYLLQESAEAQLEMTRYALRLARLAGHLAPHLAPPAADEFLARALCLEGNALRLTGEPELAAETFVSAVPALQEPADHAVFSRGLGLVRWEQGRTDEALALFKYAGILFGEEAPAERAAALLLQGVLLAELGSARAAAEVLMDIPPPDRHPALCGRAVLSLAFAIEPEYPDRDNYTRHLLEKGVSVYPLLGRDTEELNSLYRLEARVQAKLGRIEEARETLGRLRNHHLERGDLAELALATFDLLALQAAAGELPSVVPFRRDLEGFALEDGGPLALAAIDRMLATEAADPWESAFDAGAWLVRLLRFSRIPTRPIPFA